MKIYDDSADLVAQFLAGGGQVTKCPTKACSGNDGKEFTHTRESLRQKRMKK